MRLYNFKITLIISIIISQLLQQFKCGQIFGTEILVKYPIATQATEYQFKILLETQLKSSNYLCIKWPYQLEYLIGKDEVKITIQDLKKINPAITTSSLTIQDNTYHFQFPIDLLPYNWYHVKLVGVINLSNPQIVGFQNLVSISTVTSTQSNALYIDSNPLFGLFALSSAPPNTATIEATYAELQDDIINLPGKDYIIILRLITQKSVSSYDEQHPSGVNYEITMTDVSFQFKDPSQCIFLNRVANECSCAYASPLVKSKLIVSCKSDLIVENTQTIPIQFSLPVVNSMRIVSNTEGFSLRVIYPPTKLLVETGSLNNFFKVSTMALKNMQIKLMHGIPYSSSFQTTYEAPLGIYIPSNINPMFQPFNSVRVIFQIGISTNTDTELLIEGHFNQAEAILESSVCHNLPQFNPAQPIRCQFDYQLKIIRCKGVGGLLPSTDYFIAARIALSSSANLQLGSDGYNYIQYFGGIQVKSVLYDSDGNVFYGEVSEITYAANQILAFRNTEFTNLTPGTGTHTLKNFGANIVSTAVQSGTFAAALQSNMQNNAKIGIFPSTTPARLIFYVEVKQDQQTYQDFLGFQQQTHMKLIYNDNVILMDPTDLANGIEIQNNPVTNNYFSAYQSGSEDNKIKQQLDLSGQNLYKYAYLLINTQRAIFQGDNLGFGFQNVKYPATFKSSQFVADDRVLDFLLSFMYLDDSRGTQSTNKLLTNKSMLFHGYTVYTSYINDNYEAAFTNIFIKKQEYNKGLKIPTLLRIFGTLTASELPSPAPPNLKLAIIPDRSVQKFFAMNQFDVPFGQSANEGCGGKTSDCFSYDDGGSLKINSPPDNWQFNPFILLNIPSLTVEISEVIAILMKPQQLPRTLNIGIVQILPSGIIEVHNVLRVYGASLGLLNFAADNRYFYDINSISQSSTTWDQSSKYSENSAQVASTYGIENLGLIIPSGQATTFQFLSTHSDSSNLISVNSGKNFGAGFTISSFKKDLIGDSQLQTFPGVTNINKCVQKFKYKVTSVVDQPYYNYIVYCPYDNPSYTDGAASKGMTFNNFKFPNLWAVGFPLSNTFAYSWSANSGKLIDLSLQILNAPATAFQNKCEVTAFDQIYKLQTERQQISITITPSVKAELTSISHFYKVQLIFTGTFPTGVSFLSQCSVNTVLTPSSNINPTFTSCTARITLPNILTFVIQKNQDNSSIITFDNAQKFIINFFMSHSGASSAASSFTAQILFNSYLQDKCIPSGTVVVPDGTAPDPLSTPSMTIANIKSSNPTIGANTVISWEFNFLGRNSIPDTTIRFNLGFLSTPKMLSNLDCQVFETQLYNDYFPEGIDNGPKTGLKPSIKFSQISYNSQTNTIDIVFGDQYSPTPTSPFIMKCFGFKTPNGENTQNLSASWIDTQNENKVIQLSTTNIGYNSLKVYKAKKMTDQQLKLISKRFSSPGFEAVYTIQFIPTNVRMTQQSVIYIEFSVGYMQNLNQRQNSPQCTLNDQKVTCLLDQQNARRLIIYPLYGKLTTLEPLKTYILVIAGIQQPQALDTYGNIWFGIDADNDLTNGLQEQGDIKDQQVQSSKITYLQNPSYTYSSLKIRQQRVMLSLNFTCSTRTITSNRVALLRLHPAFFNSQLEKQQDEIVCQFYREGDPYRKNFTSSCERIYGNSFLRMNLTGDDYNIQNSASYWIQIFYLPSPDYSNSVDFPLFLNFFITDLTMNTILYASSPSLTQLPALPISFQSADDTKKTIMWYSYYEDENIQKKQQIFNQYSGRDRLVTITIYRGIITKNTIYLSFLNPSTYFDIDYSFYFTELQEIKLFDIFLGKQKIESNSIKINTGEDGVKMSIAAKKTTPLGTYTLELKKIGLFKPFEDPEISPLPNLVVNVQDIQCQIALSSKTLSIPQGSQGGPITIDFSNCMPSQEMIILGKFNPLPANDKEIIFSTQDSQIISFIHQTQAIYYFTVDKSTTVGNTYKVKFTMSGVNSDQFILTENELTITIIAALTIQPTVILSQYTQTLSTDQSSIDISAQCNQNGYFYWAIGINEKYINNALFTTNISLLQIFQQTSYTLPQNIVSLQYILRNMRYKSFMWVSQTQTTSSTTTTTASISELSNEELLARQYGYMQVTSGTTFTLKLIDLPQRTQYSFISYCVNLQNESSLSKTSSFETSWRLDGLGNKIQSYNHLQIDLTFSKAMSDDQLNNIECQLQQALEINIYSLTTSSCRLCNQSSSYTISSPATVQDFNLSPTVCPQIQPSNPIVYTFYAWSGEQSTGVIEDISSKIQNILTNTPCFFTNILNYSYDLDIIKSYSQIQKITIITPQNIANIQPKLDLKAFDFTDTNVTLSVTNGNTPGFLIIGGHLFEKQKDNNNNQGEQNKDGDYLSIVDKQPNPLQLRQGYFGDGTQMNYAHQVIPLNAGQLKNITFNLTLQNEYAFYWTISSYESCADSLYAPIQHKQFIFKGLNSYSNILINTIQVIIINIIIVLL